MRQQAIRALAAIGDRSAADAIKTKLADPDIQVRVQAALALGRFGDNSGLPVGIDLLKNPEARLRQQGAQVVGALGDQQAGLKALDDSFQSEKDPATKQMIDLARAQLKARLGVRESAPTVSAVDTTKAGTTQATVDTGKTTVTQATVNTGKAKTKPAQKRRVKKKTPAPPSPPKTP